MAVDSGEAGFWGAGFWGGAGFCGCASGAEVVRGGRSNVCGRKTGKGFARFYLVDIRLIHCLVDISRYACAVKTVKGKNAYVLKQIKRGLVLRFNV